MNFFSWGLNFPNFASNSRTSRINPRGKFTCKNINIYNLDNAHTTFTVDYPVLQQIQSEIVRAFSYLSTLVTSSL